MNTPYQSREREQLRTIAAEMRRVKAEEIEQLSNNLVLKNEATVAAVSTFSKVTQPAATDVVMTEAQPVQEEANTEDQPMHQEEKEPSEQDLRAMSNKILNLKLPEHMNHLMRLFEQFEMNFRLFRNRHDEWTTSLEAISTMIEGSF